MKDPFETFVTENRKDFDIHEPSISLWKGIEQDLGSKKKPKFFRIVGIAASILILISAGYFVGLSNNDNEFSQQMFADETQYNDFIEANQFYNRTIDYKIAEAKSIGVEEDVLTDLEQLDEVYLELKEEMLNSAYKDKDILVNLMIKNYKSKIEILERIIGKTKKAQQVKNTKNETIDI